MSRYDNDEADSLPMMQFLDMTAQDEESAPSTLPVNVNKHDIGAQHQHTQAMMRRSFRARPVCAVSPCPPSPHIEKPSTMQQVEFPSRALYLIQAYRMHGHLHAALDPLHLHRNHTVSSELELSYFGLSEQDLDTSFPTGDLHGPARLTLRQILDVLQQTYCGHIAPELMHISNTAKRVWFQERLESMRSSSNYSSDKRKAIFKRIVRAEEFERFLHTRYAGQKRFSLEGGESLIPMLDALIDAAAAQGVEEMIMGMAHRGRLNVLANIMGKSLSDVFAEFEGNVFTDAAQGAGDVKYHQGCSSDIDTDAGRVHLSLAFNPSHLEAITPVILGSVRARQCRRKDGARRKVMGVLLHGDAAFAGQGIVAESLNLGELSGYKTGGTIHIVVNNQIGFTTNPFDARSTLYCTDIAKVVQAPILHVNGDDPEACCVAMELAMEYRLRFRSDVVIDLVCYRRHGHNEADAPEITQPLMYQAIGKHPSLQALYGERLMREGVLYASEADTVVEQYRQCLTKVNEAYQVNTPTLPNSLTGRWEGFVRKDADEPDTAVAGDVLASLMRRVYQMPDNVRLDSKVQRILNKRIAMAEGNEAIDWGAAEAMAYASLVHEGGWVRIAGQDSGRGTFAHRHATVYDQRTGQGMMPIRNVENGPLSHFIVIDSMLSEAAVLGFEYGYSIAEPRALVIWEAQFGDFANNAQVIIDQFIASGESKWQRMSGIVLWLPHGYEGQGGEHSSARLERFLQLAAEDNIQVVSPSTPAQLFHLLRRQLMIRTRKPLVLMAPKSLLRRKSTFSQRSDFTIGSFQTVLPEIHAEQNTSAVQRVLLCSGKVYYDLLEHREKQGIQDIAMLRLECLYPFPSETLQAILAKYTSATDVIWVQEEPENQGAWHQIKHHLMRVLLDQQRLYHVSRDALAAPASGSAARHAAEQDLLISRAFEECLRVE